MTVTIARSARRAARYRHRARRDLTRLCGAYWLWHWRSKAAVAGWTPAEIRGRRAWELMAEVTGD